MTEIGVGSGVAPRNAGETPAGLSELEESIRGIAGIRAVSLVTQLDGQLTEVHVLTSPGYMPNHVVHDVRSIATRRHHLEIDPGIITVVQIADSGTPLSATTENASALREFHVAPQVTRLDDALLELELSDDLVHVFADAETGQTSVLFRDGRQWKFGLVRLYESDPLKIFVADHQVAVEASTSAMRGRHRSKRSDGQRLSSGRRVVDPNAAERLRSITQQLGAAIAAGQARDEAPNHGL